MTRIIFRVVCWSCLVSESKVSDLSQAWAPVPFDGCKKQVCELEVPIQDPNCIIKEDPSQVLEMKTEGEWGGGLLLAASAGSTWK